MMMCSHLVLVTPVQSVRRCPRQAAVAVAVAAASAAVAAVAAVAAAADSKGVSVWSKISVSKPSSKYVSGLY